MTLFSQNKINVLVSTSVIEVGIDVPNDTIMVIEAAERFGLSQLHQFRGRVGRGEHQSYCFLFMKKSGQEASKRLQAMVDFTSGFKLAEIDLQIRGPGEIYGVRQSGIPDLKMASLSDSFTISLARQAAQSIINQDPELTNYPLLKAKINELEEVFVKD
jgi:ATP-dependent DNA helicase RecG